MSSSFQTLGHVAFFASTYAITIPIKSLQFSHMASNAWFVPVLFIHIRFMSKTWYIFFASRQLSESLLRIISVTHLWKLTVIPCASPSFRSDDQLLSDMQLCQEVFCSACCVRLWSLCRLMETCLCPPCLWHSTSSCSIAQSCRRSRGSLANLGRSKV